MGGRTWGRARRWAAGGVLAAVSATTLAACAVPAPPGNAPLRYRDKVFTGVTVVSDVVYGNAPDLTGTPVDLKTDIYTPTGDTQTSRPAIIWVHGGAFAAGDKAKNPFPKLANEFAQRGYVALSINYRLMSTEKCAGVHPPPASCQAAATDAQHDAQAAVRWLRAHAAQYGVDPNRIAIGGGRPAPTWRSWSAPTARIRARAARPARARRSAAWSRSPASCRPRARRSSAPATRRRCGSSAPRIRSSPMRTRSWRTPARSTTPA